MGIARRFKTAIYALLILSFLGTIVLAKDNDVEVATSFDRRSAEVNEQINMMITIKGTSTNVMHPRIPTLKAFETYYTGRASNFTFINGRSESTTTFSYVFVPKVPGKFTIPPVEVEVNGRLFRSTPVEIEVFEGSGQQQVPPRPQFPQNPQAAAPVSTPYAAQAAAGPQPQAAASVPVTSEGSGDSNIFIRVTADKREVYPNEQILLTYNIYTRYDTRYEGFEEEPSTSGFWVEEFPLGKELEKSVVQIGGRRYISATIRRIAIFPTAPGSYDITPGSVRATVKEDRTTRSMFDDFFEDSFFSGSDFFAQRLEKRLSAPPLHIEVKPLPEEGKPVDFSGLVGNFTIKSSLDKRTVKQSEPIIMTIVVEGDGNIETLEKPQLADLPKFKVRDSGASTQLLPSKNVVRGRKTFEVILIPQEAGDFTIPPVSFNFFNPSTRRYIEQKTGQFNVKVEPGPVGPSITTMYPQREEAKKGLKIESRDIYFIKETFAPKSLFETEVFLTRILGGLAFLGTVVWLALFAMRRREQVLDKNIALKRRIMAPRKLRKGLREVKRCLASGKEGSEKRFFEGVRRTLDQYFSDKFNLSPQGLTRTVVEERLNHTDTPQDIIDRMHKLYEQCDLVHFTQSKVSKETMAETWKVLTELIQDLEKKR